MAVDTLLVPRMIIFVVMINTAILNVRPDGCFSRWLASLFFLYLFVSCSISYIHLCCTNSHSALLGRVIKYDMSVVATLRDVGLGDKWEQIRR